MFAKYPGSARTAYTFFSSLAVKVPRWLSGSGFREGREANRSERDQWRQTHCEKFCPVWLGDPFGLFVLMPFARPLTDDEWWRLYQEDIAGASRTFVDRASSSDFKRTNFGMWRGRIVKIDYEILRRR